MSKSKVIFSVLFSLLVLTGFVIAGGGGAANPALRSVLCSNGIVGDLDIDLELPFNIEGFGNNLEWYLLDEVEVEVGVENGGNEDIEDIILSWGLYNIRTSQLIIGEDNEADFNLNEGEDKIVIFSFTVNPEVFDTNDLNGDFILYVKAYSNDLGEENQCNYNSQNVEIILDNNFVVLDNIEINPERIIVGGEIQISAEVWNIGEDNQDDVSVRIFNEELGIDERVFVGDEVFDKIYSLSKENLETNISIPEEVEEGNYVIRFEILDENNDIYENGDGDELIYAIPVFVEEKFEINILTPQDDSTIKGDFTFLKVSTNENAVCEYSLGFFGPGYGGASRFIEMETTGEDVHFQKIENLEETKEGEKYRIRVNCTDESGNTAETQVEFYVDLTELREMMILEDIGNYVFMGADNIGEEFDSFINSLESYDDVEFHVADYSKNDEQKSVVVVKFNSQEDALDYLTLYSLPNYFEFDGQKIYYYNDGEVIVTWVSGNYFILMDETPIAWEIISAYLEKFPSDLNLDTIPPTIEIIKPSADYVKKTSKDSYEMDFSFEVNDESEIAYCELIVDGIVEDLGRDIQKNVEIVFSEKLKKGSYDWQIKCVDSKGNEGSSEIRDLRIKEKSSSPRSLNNLPNQNELVADPLIHQNELIDLSKKGTTSLDSSHEENGEWDGVIHLNPKNENEYLGFFKVIFSWFRGLFG